MKKVIWRNADLDEPYEGIPGDGEIVVTQDGWIYCGNTANDPIDRGDWLDFLDETHQPEEL